MGQLALGKAEVVSSILTGSTIFPTEIGERGTLSLVPLATLRVPADR